MPCPWQRTFQHGGSFTSSRRPRCMRVLLRWHVGRRCTWHAIARRVCYALACFCSSAIGCIWLLPLSGFRRRSNMYLSSPGTQISMPAERYHEDNIPCSLFNLDPVASSDANVKRYWRICSNVLSVPAASTSPIWSSFPSASSASSVHVRYSQLTSRRCKTEDLRSIVSRC